MPPPINPFESLRSLLHEEGIIFERLMDANVKYPELLEKYGGPCSSSPLSGVAELGDGTFVFVPQNKICDFPLQPYSGRDDKAQHHLVIVASENSSLEFVSGCVSRTASILGQLTGTVQILALDGARVRFIALKNRDRDVVDYTSEEIRVGNSANVESVNIDIGDSLRLMPSSVSFSGKNASYKCVSVNLNKERTPHALELLKFENAEGNSIRIDDFSGVSSQQIYHSTWQKKADGALKLLSTCTTTPMDMFEFVKHHLPMEYAVELRKNL